MHSSGKRSVPDSIPSKVCPNSFQYIVEETGESGQSLMCIHIRRIGTLHGGQGFGFLLCFFEFRSSFFGMRVGETHLA